MNVCDINSTVLHKDQSIHILVPYVAITVKPWLQWSLAMLAQYPQAPWLHVWLEFEPICYL